MIIFLIMNLIIYYFTRIFLIMKKISKEVEKCALDEPKNDLFYRKISQKFNILLITVGNIAKRSGLTYLEPHLGRNWMLSLRGRSTVQHLVALGEANQIISQEKHPRGYLINLQLVRILYWPIICSSICSMWSNNRSDGRDVLGDI